MTDLLFDEEERGFIKGEILFTIFENEAEHFSIAKLKISDTNEPIKEKEIVGKGYFANLQEGSTYFFYGKLINHPKFGMQYEVDSFETFVPATKDGLISYLSSDLFPGIGVKIAESIVNRFGEDAINEILKNPKEVYQIPHLNNKTASNLISVIQSNQGFEQVVIQLSKFGIGLKMAQQLYNTYKEDTSALLLEDPYTFVYDIEGFGFKMADKIGQMNGISLTHHNRVGAAIIFVLEESMQSGHVYLPEEALIEQTFNVLNTSDMTKDLINEVLLLLNEKKKIKIKDEKIYLIKLYYAEDGFSSHLKRIMSIPIDEETPTSDLLKIAGDIEETEIISYGEEQFNAISQAINSKVMILTGGPGTGKTTVIKGILKAFSTIHALSMDADDYKSDEDFPFILTAPTGRAAKRLQESTGIKATTIHRLLGWDGSDHFEKNEFDQLSGRYLIIDEFSMVDIWLANNLFKAIPSDMQVLLVGDEDQLPSVGPGQVLSDLLNSQLIPLVTLNEVYRQKEGSKIIQLAHKIKNNESSEADLSNDVDFSFIPCQTHQVVEVITTVIEKAIEKDIDAKDIQVLAPMYRTNAGINIINKELQALINPPTKGKREIKVFDDFFRVGDKVIQLVNQPEDGVSNGDIGEVIAIFRANENVDKQEEIVIAYEDLEVVYRRSEFQNIMLAYCISIHKSQGSEFPIVIMPIVPAYNRMLRKNLIYTAITRSQSSLIICGDMNAFFQGVKTNDTNLRYTFLKEQLQIKLGNDDFSSINEPNNSGEFSPYDFME